MIKKFKCRTFPKEDYVIFDYGKEHILITIVDTEYKKKLNICLNDFDIDKLIEYLMSIRKHN